MDLGGCGRLLSRYNPYVVCGPCRVRLANDVADEVGAAEIAEDAAPIVFAWERFPRRHVVRYGALLPDTGQARVIGG